MRDWMIILGIAVLTAIVGFLVMRRRGREVVDAVDAAPAPSAVGAEPKPATVQASRPAVEAGPPLAMLYFDSAPGKVAVLQSEIVIGRHSEDDIRVPDVRVSRHHAKLVAKRGGGFEIHNLTAVRSEPNPMLVNGEAREHADITDGDIVSLGGVNFTFRLAA